ncbi:DUF2339 domain-containing protein [Jannaschia sp. Os4]|uniref:DUF2339 domain-containing protein n=1 Tax=Jannaschia sp. Os4 TaxID=2807617 RepID=UPI00193ABF13|nr:DUF2339 domain-containing protein [Jannaschia sp. Os4]MBM2576009.1 DUF2339 domain-containing protein [Jannaschia sp. Os4]
MEDLLILLAVAALVAIVAAPVLAFVALSRTSDLRRRVAHLEEDVLTLAETLRRRPAAEPAKAAPSAAPSAAPAPATRPAAAAAPPPAATAPDPERRADPWGRAGSRTADAVAPAPRTPAVAPPPKPVDPSPLDRAARWAAQNWFYLVAAASLALAGIYLVQWGAERGLLPPAMRVAAALAFGAALIGGGEWLRRRFGDEGDVATRHLPSVLSGAGVVTLFAAVLAAIHLYALIGPVAGLVALVAVAALAIVLGWFSGPLLVAVGLVGATVAPFAVGGASDDPSLLHAYFALVALTGLAVDTLRRWMWVSLLAVGLGLAGTFLLMGAGTREPVAYAAAVAIALLAMVLPNGRLRPDQDGPMLWQAPRARPRPEARPAMLGVAGAVALIVFDAATSYPSMATAPGLAACAVLIAALAVWAERSRALQDLVLLPVAGFLLIALNPDAATVAQFTREIAPEQPGPRGATTLLALAAALALPLAWRAARPAPTWRLLWTLAAAGLAPATGLALDVGWDAPAVLGRAAWAWHAIAVAALLTGVAAWWARAVQGDGGREMAAMAALMGFVTIGYAAAQVLDKAALTLAFAGLAAGAAWMARALDLPRLGWTLVIAVPVLGFRLIADPGLSWAIQGPAGPVAAAYAGTAAALLLAAWLLRGAAPAPRLAAESGALTATATAISVPLLRWIDGAENEAGGATMGLIAAVWGTAALGQLIRAEGGLPRLRQALAALLALPAAGALALALTEFNPVLGLRPKGEVTVLGPPLLNSLVLAYLAPAAILWLAHRRLGWRWPLWGAGALAGLWAVLAIRHAWQGPSEMPWVEGIGRGEMLTYTAVLLIAGAAAFFRGLTRGEPTVRRVGTGLLALTAAKVFLVDAAALQGLARVGAFVALGLSLAGLAWLDRRAAGAPVREAGEEGRDDAPPDEGA